MPQIYPRRTIIQIDHTLKGKKVLDQFTSTYSVNLVQNGGKTVYRISGKWINTLNSELLKRESIMYDCHRTENESSFNIWIFI